MEAITAFMEDFDIARLLPELGELISTMRFWAGFFVLIGPIIMTLFGAWYFFLPTKEANHHIGFRTYFSMGSVAAWRYSQRLAGMFYMGCGGAFTLLGIILCIIMLFLKPMAMATTCFVVILLQAMAVVALWIILQVLILKKYDKNGNPR